MLSTPKLQPARPGFGDGFLALAILLESLILFAVYFLTFLTLLLRWLARRFKISAQKRGDPILRT